MTIGAGGETVGVGGTEGRASQRSKGFRGHASCAFRRNPRVDGEAVEPGAPDGFRLRMTVVRGEGF